MARYASGDDDAFAEVYDALAARLFGYLRHQLRDEALAEDLLQEAMMHMHRARGTFIVGADVVPWAFAIARRVMIDHHRLRRNAPPVGPLGQDGPAALAMGASADQDLEVRELASAFERALERLPSGQRDAFRLLKQEGLSIDEAARALGTTAGAVKLRAHRAYEALRAVRDKIRRAR
jgi:RNA polymerase sigma-70 factor (ECF subfamily)